MNCELRKIALISENPDIICLTETHLQNKESVDWAGYHTFTLNRLNIDLCANRGSGGVSILVRNVLKNDFEVSECYTCRDNVLGVSIVNKLSKESYIIYCV